MKSILALIILMASISSAQAYDVYVHGYERSNGTHVDGYHRSSPDSVKWNNYGYDGD